MMISHKFSNKFSLLNDQLIATWRTSVSPSLDENRRYLNEFWTLIMLSHLSLNFLFLLLDA